MVLVGLSIEESWVGCQCCHGEDRRENQALHKKLKKRIEESCF